MDIRYEYWLASVKGVGNRAAKQLRKYAGDAKNVYEMSTKDLSGIFGLREKSVSAILESKSSWDIDGEYEKLLETDIHFVVKGEEGYPKKLMDIADPPGWLFYIGRLPNENDFSVAIVGARACSDRGAYAATELGKKCADKGITVISGMARGIDGHAHMGCMEHGGMTAAVLGCGVNVVYPPEHWKMYEDILKSGGAVISEYPPDYPACAGCFPMRNRIISGLSDAVIVVEARERSGSLITADHALEQGKDIYAVPGPMGDLRCLGSNRLIKQGAGIILSAEDLMSDLGLLCSFTSNGSDKKILALEKEESKVYSTLNLCPESLDKIAYASGLGPVEAAVALMSLVDKGFVKECSGLYAIKT